MEPELRLIEKHITGSYSYNRWAQTCITLPRSQWEKRNVVTDTTHSVHTVKAANSSGGESIFS